MCHHCFLVLNDKSIRKNEKIQTKQLQKFILDIHDTGSRNRDKVIHNFQTIILRILIKSY